MIGVLKVMLYGFRVLFRLILNGEEGALYRGYVNIYFIVTLHFIVV